MAAHKKPVSDLTAPTLGLVNLILGIPLFGFVASPSRSVARYPDTGTKK